MSETLEKQADFENTMRWQGTVCSVLACAQVLWNMASSGSNSPCEAEARRDLKEAIADFLAMDEEVFGQG